MDTRQAGISSPAAVEVLHDQEQRAPDVLIAAEVTVHSNAEQRHVVPAHAGRVHAVVIAAQGGGTRAGRQAAGLKKE